jgi:hypothetical protein
MKYPAEFTAEINGFLSQPGWGHRAWRSRLFCAASFAIKLEALSPDVTAGSLMQLRHSPEWPEVRVFRVVTSDNTGAIVSVECDAETSYRTGERMTASHKLKEEFPCHKPLLAKVT